MAIATGQMTQNLQVARPAASAVGSQVGALCLALCMMTAMCRANDASAKRPNIVFILCDDLGYADVGFNAKHFGVKTDVVTPNLDELARRGTIFSQAYVAHPFCGPSRMALLSGRMPHCFGGQKNLPDVAKNLEDYNGKGIPESETLISSVLQRRLVIGQAVSGNGISVMLGRFTRTLVALTSSLDSSAAGISTTRTSPTRSSQRSTTISTFFSATAKTTNHPKVPT
jgi:hypothetical protein